MQTKRMFLFLIVAIGVMCAISSCKKDEVVTSDTQKPTITMEEPSTNDTISVGSSEVHIEFTASDNDRLQTLSVRVSNPADSTLFSSTPNVPGLQTYPFHQHITPTATAVVQLTLTVTATDFSGNRTTTTVIFFIKP